MGKTKLILRKSYQNKQGESNIFVRYSHKDKTVDFATGERVPAQFWDQSNQRVRKSYKGHTALNDFIEQKRNEIENIRLQLKSQKTDPTIEAVRSIYKNEGIDEFQVSLPSQLIFDHWNDFKNYQRGVERLSEETWNQYEVSKKIFEEFEKHIGSKIDFEMVTQNLYEDFVIFAYDTKEYAPNTLSNKLKHFKKFLSFCQERGIHDNSSYKKFRKPSNETNNITLTIAQLKHLTMLDLSAEKRLERARDLFVIGCTTGLRFSDFSVLLPGNIQDDYITISTEKMDRTVRIPISDYTRQILMRYPNGQLPTMTNQEMNRILKDVGMRANFTELHEVTSFKRGVKCRAFKPLYAIVTTHMGRRTFISQSLEKSIEPSIIMKVTGHKDLRSFSRYIHLHEKRVKDQITAAWKFQD